MVKIRKTGEITEGVYALYDTMFPLYYIIGDKSFLVDCSVRQRKNQIKNSLKEISRFNGIDTVLLTHSHYDHTGACSELQLEYGFDIKGSKRCIELLKKEKVVNFIDSLNLEFMKMKSDETLKKPLKSEFSDLKILKDGQRISVDKERYFEVIYTPGHTKCSASYILYPDNILFPGDSCGVLERDGSYKPLFLSGYSDYLRSLDKLISLKPEFLCLSHNMVISGRERSLRHLKNALKAAESLKGIISKKLRSVSDPALIAEELLRQVYPDSTVAGPPRALIINLESMVRVINREFNIISL